MVKVKSRSENNRSRLDKFAHLKADPEFKEFLKEIVDQQVKADRAERRADYSHSPVHRNGSKGRSKPKKGMVNQPFLVKSPSDTTLYSPGLRKVNNEDVTLIEKISNFVESIWLEDRLDRSRQCQSNSPGYQLSSASQDSRRVENVSGSGSRNRSPMVIGNDVGLGRHQDYQDCEHGGQHSG